MNYQGKWIGSVPPTVTFFMVFFWKNKPIGTKKLKAKKLLPAIDEASAARAFVLGKHRLMDRTKLSARVYRRDDLKRVGTITSIQPRKAA
jgi:hypothetical protein